MWKSQVGSNVVADTADDDDWETEADYEVSVKYIPIFFILL